ncbi:kinase-like domain-containing protein, partial [Chytriomyces sp. MP71]
MNEFCISSSLDHENIVKTVDLIQDEKKKWCVVMDYAEGGSLFPKIVNGSLSDPVVINCFFKQLLRGVAYLHSQGVAHRDLKPENLLLDASNRILKITDFGVSDVFRGPWQTQSRKACGECGSGPYIAPEIFVDKEYDAEQVDVWSMGVIYYAMIYRSTPWNSAKNSDARYRVFAENREDYWTTFRMVPPASEVREVLYRILEPNPTKRAHVHEILEDPFIQGIECCESGIPTHMVAHSHHGL